MQQHRPSCLSDVSVGSLSDAILEVSVDATEAKCLLLLLARCFECVVGKSAIVCMICFDAYAVIACKSLEGSLGINCFLRSEVSHQMDIAQS